MNKLFLCGITSDGQEENLRAMIEPIKKYFNGIVFTFHGPKDGGAEYLESVKGEGDVIYAKWCQRHGYSMTHFLNQGPMEEGDKFIVLDSTERISSEFCDKMLPEFIKEMDKSNIAMVANYGKGFLFRYNERLQFSGSPHWFAEHLDGQMINVELPKDCFWNVRGEQRDEWQFLEHYLRYFLYPAGSNHMLLGLEKNGDPKVLFPILENQRIEFRKILKKRCYPLTVEGVKKLMIDGLDEETKFYVRTEKILNDFYRYHVLGLRDFKDDHDFKNLVPIP